MAWCNLYDCDLNEIEDKKGKDFIYESCGEAYYYDYCSKCENNSDNIQLNCSRCGDPIVVNAANYDENIDYICCSCFDEINFD